MHHHTYQAHFCRHCRQLPAREVVLVAAVEVVEVAAVEVAAVEVVEMAAV